MHQIRQKWYKIQLARKTLFTAMTDKVDITAVAIEFEKF